MITTDGRTAEPGDVVELTRQVGGHPPGTRVTVLDVARRDRGVLDVEHPTKRGRRWVALCHEVRVIERAGIPAANRRGK